jgi:hypothetical protein
LAALAPLDPGIVPSLQPVATCSAMVSSNSCLLDMITSASLVSAIAGDP